MARKIAKRRTGPNATPQPRRRRPKPSMLELYKSFIRAHGEEYLKDGNITGLGIGYKTVGGKPTDQLSVQFTVAQKVSPESVERVSSKPIPRAIPFRGQMIMTDVVQRTFAPGYVVVQSTDKSDRKTRCDPVVAGVSVANASSSAGTLGALVRDRSSGETVLLSNWHVLHTPTGRIGDVVVQPGPFDDNRIEANRVGRLLRSHLGAAGDCALASIEGRKIDPRVLGIPDPGVIARLGKPALGDRVVKSGRTTGVTFGLVTRVETLTRIDYGAGTSANIGGFEIGPDADNPAPDLEISKGGDSGAAWIAVAADGAPTDVMLGLHFAGDSEGSEGEFALACYASSVFEKLEIEPLPKAAGPVNRKASRQSVTEHPELRRGFDPDFLDFPVPEPTFLTSLKADLAKLDGSARIDYCHFSLWLSKNRRFPRVVAWNIDGASLRALSRSGIEFKVDERGSLSDFQVDDELYADNPFDRGHVARRADLCWGPLTEARQGNRDSFFFSNITPQHARFNQGMRGGLWGRLEDAIFNDVAVRELRVSLMGGPILRDSDPEYRHLAKVPREFWKIIAYGDDADGRNKVRAFVLTQRDLVKSVVSEILELGEFHWYQVPLTRIEMETGVRFAAGLKALDAMPAGPQAVEGLRARLIEDSSDFFV